MLLSTLDSWARLISTPEATHRALETLAVRAGDADPALRASIEAWLAVLAPLRALDASASGGPAGWPSEDDERSWDEEPWGEEAWEDSYDEDESEPPLVDPPFEPRGAVDSSRGPASALRPLEVRGEGSR